MILNVTYLACVSEKFLSLCCIIKIKAMKYMIDCLSGSGSGCDELFDSKYDAEVHMSFWTPEERENCVIVEVAEE